MEKLGHLFLVVKHTRGPNAVSAVAFTLQEYSFFLRGHDTSWCRTLSLDKWEWQALKTPTCISGNRNPLCLYQIWGGWLMFTKVYIPVEMIGFPNMLILLRMWKQKIKNVWAYNFACVCGKCGCIFSGNYSRARGRDFSFRFWYNACANEKI